jgi:capsule polysaccharide export protein KpsE/RkpR
MSEHSMNYFGVAVKANHEKNPDLMKVDVPAIEEAAAKVREARAAANPPKPIPARVEYDALRKAQFNLQNSVTGCEVRLKDARETVVHWEKSVASLLKKKQAASVAMELGNVRGYEHNLVAAETDLGLAQTNLTVWKKEHTQVVQTLRTWQAENLERMSELEKLV